MSSSMPIEDSSDRDASGADRGSSRPDWLMDAAEGTQQKPPGHEPDAHDGEAQATAAAAPRLPASLKDRHERPKLRVVGANEAPPTPEPPAEPADSPARPEAWKAASSSVPKLRQKPAAGEQAKDIDGFAGFAQDGIAGKAPGRDAQGERPVAASRAPAEPEPVAPLGGEPAFWVIWLDHLRFLRHPAAIGGAAVLVLVLALANLLAPRVQTGESLARIRQQPETFEGRAVTVSGVAGEAYPVGPNFAFNLYQGRDTIVVYSQTRHPRLHEKLQVDGTISVGYLDGVPRITLLETAKR